MTLETLFRGLAGAAAFAAGPRGGRLGVAAAGGLAGFAVFGGMARPFPSPLAAAILLLVLTALFAAVFAASWSAITGDAALAGALLAVPSSLAAAVALRGQPASLVLPGALGTLAGVSVFAALGTLANAESGWRKSALWAAAVAVPVLLAAGVAALAAPAARRPAVGALAAAVAVLAWAPVILLERERVKNELREEVLLGFLPDEDAVVLQLPWTRASEKRFGRADERREYVRSALLLAVARRQQRRRSGDAERLRQLEVLTFRTRLRRTLDARAARYERADLAEVPALEDPGATVSRRGEEGVRGNAIGVPPEQQ